MSNGSEHLLELRALAMRVAALEDNVAFLEQWCEEQQDALDRVVGPIPYDYERPDPCQVLRIVDLRDRAGADPDPEDDADDLEEEDDAIVAVVETDHERRVRQLQTKLNRIRSRLALSVAPPAGAPGAARPGFRRVSAKQAGRTAP
jgi:hypothetical protein